MKSSLDRLNLGCGLVTPAGWLNVDGSWNARLAKFPVIHKLLLRALGRKAVYEGAGSISGHDVRKPLPWDDGSFQAVYASHLLEHLYLNEADRLLRECFRVLRPGGVVRVVVPDLEVLVRGYHTGAYPPWFERYPRYDSNPDRFVRSLLMREPIAPSGNLFARVFDALTDFHSHKWMYNSSSIAARVRAAGFSDVRTMGCWESRIQGIERIERRDRVEEGAGVVVEGVRPSG